MKNLDRSIKNFRSNFFTSSGILDSVMNHVQGKMQAEASLENKSELDEGFFKNAIENVLRRKIELIDRAFDVTCNKNFAGLAVQLKKYSNATLRMQADFIVKATDSCPLAVIELKSIFGIGTTKDDVLKDIVRLAIFIKLFPESICIFIIAGKRDEMKRFFDNSEFSFDDNIRQKIKAPYSWHSLSVDNLNLRNEYKIVLQDLDIREILVRLSRTQRSSKYHSMSYRIKIADPGYRPMSDFSQSTWDDINSGDIVSVGISPADNIGDCMLVDKIDLNIRQVMYQTNDVDDQTWTEIDLDDIVWKYFPRAGRI